MDFKHILILTISKGKPSLDPKYQNHFNYGETITTNAYCDDDLYNVDACPAGPRMNEPISHTTNGDDLPLITDSFNGHVT